MGYSIGIVLGSKLDVDGKGVVSEDVVEISAVLAV